jgi:hypothetical protein
MSIGRKTDELEQSIDQRQVRDVPTPTLFGDEALKAQWPRFRARNGHLGNVESIETGREQV